MKNLFVYTVSVLVFIFSSQLFAKGKEHRHHEAHEHGAATLAIAFEGKGGRVEFKAASEGVLGFEHEVKNEKDKKTLDEAKSKFEQIEKMIQFDSKLKCVFKAEKIEMIKEESDEDHGKKHAKDHDKAEGEHSDFVANFVVNCDQAVAGTQVKIDFTGFKRLKDIDVTLLIDSLQKSAEVKRKPVTIDLK